MAEEDYESDPMQLSDKVEELTEALQAATEVNRHLAAEVERLSLDNDSLRQHLLYTRKRLKPHAPAAAPPQPANGEEQGAPAAAPPVAELSQLGLEDAQPEGVEDAAALAVVSTADWARLKAYGRSHGWLVDPGQCVLGAIAGEGSFGVTHRAVWRGADCAIKVVRADAPSAESFARELSAMALVRHPHVVSLYGAVVEPPERCWLVCEYLSGGTLTQWLHGIPGARRPPARSLSERLRMAFDVASGMEALEQHDPPIIHRDLKPANVLLDAAGRAKVSDMGLARVLTQQALMELTPETGSYLYMAPEVVRHELYATQADVWSWGCLVSELLTGLRPYAERHLTPIQVALKVADGGLRPAIPATCPPGLAELLAAALSHDPLGRPSFAVIAAVMRRVVEEVGAREAAGSAGSRGVVSAWNRWMKPA